ncbi:HicA family protein [Candidatus Magnetoovum chiemensis]|nr:HicA family protein [Candidatus Magnetoovum chiemensis]
MSTFDKLFKKLLSKPKDFTYSELKTLLTSLGYEEEERGKTSGSRAGFINDKKNSIILLHKPHNNKHLMSYQLNTVIKELKRIGII